MPDRRPETPPDRRDPDATPPFATGGLVSECQTLTEAGIVYLTPEQQRKLVETLDLPPAPNPGRDIFDAIARAFGIPRLVAWLARKLSR